MTEDEIDALTKTLLPDWAIAHTEGQWELGAQLCTQDGRRTGNAHIIKIEYVVYRGDARQLSPLLNEPVPVTIRLYTILTDAGNELALTAVELEELFHPPKWVSDVAEVLRKFKRTE